MIFHESRPNSAPHSPSIANTVDQRIDKLIELVKKANWPTGALVTEAILVDKFSERNELCRKALRLLAKQEVLEERDGKYFTKEC